MLFCFSDLSTLDEASVSVPRQLIFRNILETEFDKNPQGKDRLVIGPGLSEPQTTVRLLFLRLALTLLVF